MCAYRLSETTTGEARMPSLTAFVPKQKLSCSACLPNVHCLASGTYPNQPTKSALISCFSYGWRDVAQN